jgi:hypothetical protein
MEGRVQIYTLSTCGHCKSTRHLKAAGINRLPERDFNHYRHDYNQGTHGALFVSTRRYN